MYYFLCDISSWSKTIWVTGLYHCFQLYLRTIFPSDFTSVDTFSWQLWQGWHVWLVDQQWLSTINLIVVYAYNHTSTTNHWTITCQQLWAGKGSKQFSSNVALLTSLTELRMLGSAGGRNCENRDLLSLDGA